MEGDGEERPFVSSNLERTRGGGLLSRDPQGKEWTRTPRPHLDFPLFPSPNHPLFFDSLSTSALLMDRRFRVAGAPDTVTPRMTHCCQMETIAPIPPGRPHFASVVVGLGLRRRQGPRQAKKLVLSTLHPPHSSPFPFPIDSSPSTASVHLDHGCAQRLRFHIVMVAALVMPRQAPPGGARQNRCVTHPRPDWLSGPRYLFRDGSLWSGSKPQHPREYTEPPAPHSLVLPSILHSTLPPSLWPAPLLFARRPSRVDNHVSSAPPISPFLAPLLPSKFPSTSCPSTSP